MKLLPTLAVLSVVGLFIMVLKLGKTEINKLKEDINIKDENIFELLEEIKVRDSIIQASYNSCVRMEMYLGVDEPDGIIQYKEKLLVSSRNVQKLNKKDLR